VGPADEAHRAGRLPHRHLVADAARHCLDGRPQGAGWGDSAPAAPRFDF
jgi:hypothetical protein